MMASERPGGMPPRVQSAPSLLPSEDGIESIFSNLSYRDFLHHEPAIAEEGEASAPAPKLDGGEHHAGPKHCNGEYKKSFHLICS